MPAHDSCVVQMGAVATGGRALGIIGPPGSGKSSLALALIDRGARLIGDDGATLSRDGAKLLIGPPPNIAGMIEVTGVGIMRLIPADPVPLALVLDLGQSGERLPGRIAQGEWLGTEIPVLAFDPGTIAPAIRAEHALTLHGLSFD